MAENQLLAAIQKRKKDNPSLTAKGISLASWHVAAFFHQLQHAAGSKSRFTQYQKAHGLKYDWPSIIKAAESKLIYEQDDAGITKGIYPNGEKFGEYEEVITPKSALDFDCVLTTKSRDRDGDVLEPTGANIDRKMPLLLHHLPTEPVGRFVKLVSQDDSGVIIKNAIVGTPIGHDTAMMVEFGCFRVSHGFEPKEYEPLSLASSAYKDSALAGVLSDDGDAGWHVKQYDVMEVSLVTIPSNPDAIITAMSKGKFHHPIYKLWAGKMAEDRPVQVTGGWDKSAPVINVNITNGGLMTKSKKEEEIEDVEEVETPAEEVAEEESEELSVEEKETALGGGLLDDIDADIKNFGKGKKLPQEAKDRVNMIRGMIAGIKQKLNGHSDAIAKALKTQNVAEVGDIHREMCDTLTNGLKRICREMDQLSTVEELSDEQRQQLMEMQSGATAAHDMFKTYKESLVVNKDSSVDGDATETEEDEDELEGMETKDDGLETFPDAFPVSDEEIIEDGRRDAQSGITQNPYPNGSHEYDLWEQGFSEVVSVPMAEIASHSVASKATSVQEQDGQFVIVDESGQVVGGPYATEYEADAMFYELQSQEEGWLSSHHPSRKDAMAGYADDPATMDGDKDITEQPMLYDANTDKPIRPATPEEVEACQNSPSGMIDIGGMLCYCKSFEVKSIGQFTIESSDAGWYVVGEDEDGRYNAAGPFATQEEAEQSRNQAMSQGGYRSADDVALKLIGLIADGKSHELRPEVATMLKRSLKGSYASGTDTVYAYTIVPREDGFYVVFETGDEEGPYRSESEAEASVNHMNDLYQAN